MHPHLHVDFALQDDFEESDIVLPRGPPLLQTGLLRGVQVPEGDLLQARDMQPLEDLVFADCMCVCTARGGGATCQGYFLQVTMTHFGISWPA